MKQPPARRLLRHIAFCALAVLAFLPRFSPAQSSTNSEYLVGVYYFSGWWRELPNKYFTAGADWRTNYPGRVPQLGEYNEQDTMDREITAASEHGVSFFQMLWYYQGNTNIGEPHAGKLNEGVRTFMASPKNRELKFTLEFVNHPPFGIDDDAAWEKSCREWCDIMRHPSYLKVGGRPVFKIHGADFFFAQNGHDPARVAARIATLRANAAKAGLPPLLIGGGVSAAAVAGPPVVDPYDFLTTYMEMANLPLAEKPYPYATLLAFAEQAWSNYAYFSKKPYVPYVPSGWDPRPWKDSRPPYDFPTEAQWLTALRDVKSALDTSSNLGLVAAPGQRQKALLIYAWNEWGEGGIVGPTRGEGDMKLRAIATVFGAPKPAK